LIFKMPKLGQSYKVYLHLRNACLLCSLLFVTLCFGQFFSMEYSEDTNKPKYSLSQPISSSLENWDLLGSAAVGENYVRLTQDEKSLQGAIWNKHPVKVPFWQAHLQFQIHGISDNIAGDGMVFWYTKDRMIPGPLFGSKDYFSGLAVFIDTYGNHVPTADERSQGHLHQHPYISVMVNNGSNKYDHDEDGTHQQIGGCAVKVRNPKNPTLVGIRYDGDTLAVVTNVQGKGYWDACAVIQGVQLPTGYYFGVSAATGDLHDIHDVQQLRVFEIPEQIGVHKVQVNRDNIVPSAPRDRPMEEEVPKSWSVLRMILVLGAVGVLAAGAYALVALTNTKTKGY